MTRASFSEKKETEFRPIRKPLCDEERRWYEDRLLVAKVRYYERAIEAIDSGLGMMERFSDLLDEETAQCACKED